MAVARAESSARLRMTNAELDEIVEGIEEFIICGNDEVEAIWRPYIDKLRALKTSYGLTQRK